MAFISRIVEQPRILCANAFVLGHLVKALDSTPRVARSRLALVKVSLAILVDITGLAVADVVR